MSEIPYFRDECVDVDRRAAAEAEAAEVRLLLGRPASPADAQEELEGFDEAIRRQRQLSSVAQKVLREANREQESDKPAEEQADDAYGHEWME